MPVRHRQPTQDRLRAPKSKGARLPFQFVALNPVLVFGAQIDVDVVAPHRESEQPGLARGAHALDDANLADPTVPRQLEDPRGVPLPDQRGLATEGNRPRCVQPRGDDRRLSQTGLPRHGRCRRRGHLRGAGCRRSRGRVVADARARHDATRVSAPAIPAAARRPQNMMLPP